MPKRNNKSNRNSGIDKFLDSRRKMFDTLGLIAGKYEARSYEKTVVEVAAKALWFCHNNGDMYMLFKSFLKELAATQEEKEDLNNLGLKID